MYYVVDEDNNHVELEKALDAITIAISAESISAVGLTLTIDGIECYGIYGVVNKINIAGSSAYFGTGNAIFTDKNHDLSYYVNGSDWVDSSNYNQSPGTFGYEWGGYGTNTYVRATGVELGLSNTDNLIEMNLQPRTSGWFVVWDKIKEFRESHSNNWFLPSKGELNLIYEARNNLNNLSILVNPYYWSSSESSSDNACYQDFSHGSQGGNSKYFHYYRSRLCVQY